MRRSFAGLATLQMVAVVAQFFLTATRTARWALLEELAESAILAPLRNAPWDTALLLTHIFGAGMNTYDMRTKIAGSRRAVMMTPCRTASS